MTPKEFTELAESVYGDKWRKPLAREIGRSPKMIRVYVSGLSPIPEPIAAQLRKLANIGPEGEIVKAAVQRHIPTVKPVTAHQIAADVASQIKNGGDS